MEYDLTQWLAQALLLLTVFAGILLTVINLPGNILIVVLALLYGWYGGFAQFSPGFLISLVLLFLLGEAVEFIAAALGVKRAKASKWVAFAAMGGAFAGGLLGTLVLPLLGSFAGAVAGACLAGYFAEYHANRDQNQAKRVALSAALGQAIGMVFKFAVAITMAGAIVWKLFS